MGIKKFIAQPIFTNAYLVFDSHAGEAIAIDPGHATSQRLVEAAAGEGVKISAIVNTHGHWDHVADNAALAKATGARILVHELDAQMLLSPTPPSNLPFEFEPSKASGFLHEGKTIEIGRIVLECLHTPGHTRGSTCLYSKAEGIVLTGDTLFEGAHGRTDFDGGSEEQILASLKRIASLPPKTRVLAGHGAETAVEKQAAWIKELV